MPKPQRTIPLHACKKILKEQGAMRVSDSALVAMQSRLNMEVEKLAGESAVYARHANRSTILASDVQLALRQRER